MSKTRISHAETRKANRNRLLSAAKHMFATIGFDSTTIKDIVRASGLGQGSFYNNFNDKQEVFEVVFAEIVEPFESILKDARARAKTAHDFIQFAYEACSRLPEQNLEVATILVRNQNIFREQFSATGSQARIRSALIDDLEKGYAVGHLRKMDFGMMADSMISLGIDLIIRTAQHPSDANVNVAFVTDLLLHGVSQRKEMIPNDE